MPNVPVHRLLGIYIGGTTDLATGCVSVGFNITATTAPSGSDAALGNVTLDYRGFKCEGQIVTENLQALAELCTGGSVVGAVQMVVKFSSAGTAYRWTFASVRMYGLAPMKHPFAGSDEPISRQTIRFSALFNIASNDPGDDIVTATWPP